MLLSIIIFVFILGLLVFAHELGHFIAAKRRGVKVEEFGFGFPPRLFGIYKGETVYSVNLIPLGGFVKLFGEVESLEPSSPTEIRAESDQRSFAFRSIGERAFIVMAGVVGNVALAWLLFSLAHAVGVPSIVENGVENFRDVKVVITSVAAGSPAEKADVFPGDTIVSIGGRGSVKEPVQTIEQVQDFIDKERGREIVLTLRSGNEQREITAVPRSVVPAGEGALGIAMVKTGIRSYPWYEAFGRGAWSTVQIGWGIIRGFAALIFSLFAEGRLIADVAGPVGIALLSREATLLGFSYLIFFTAILSLNLAIINSLPFPALDGGRLLFLLIERFKGSPISRRAEKIVHTVGFAFLMGLMVLITYRDIARLF